MALPYQCIQACNKPTGDGNEWILFGATGSKIVCQSSTGAKSVWPAEQSHVREEPEQEDEDQGPPGKRVKLSPPTEQTSTFCCLAVTSDRQYLVAVTAEDKCIRVLRIDENYRLHELSQRCMARRPCSIALTLDDATILCADKFGDVYSLPLLSNPEEEAAFFNENAPKVYTPSADITTVHSGRNRKILEEQLKLAGMNQQPKSKEPMKFKHELLLGHVSMLTDIVYATVGSRSYVLTADRDEHVRISRGLPQAHIIEGFCHAHEEFVSRLCLTKSGLLVSGGGDASLFVWDWQKYRLVERLAIREAALSYVGPQDAGSFKVAVSGMWSVPCSEHDEILVACEGISALFAFKVGAGATHAAGGVVPLGGNALGVTFLSTSSPGSCTAVVSVDSVHQAGSTSKVRDGGQRGPRLQLLSYQGEGQWAEGAPEAEALGWFSRWAPEDSRAAGTRSSEARDGQVLGAADEKALRAVRDVVYSVEHLRKRPGAED